jgi:hypothetical protein
MRENTSGRAFWVIWCCLWAGVWLVAAGFGNGGHLGLALVELVLAGGSGAAIALPVGKSRAIPEDDETARNRSIPRNISR